MLCEGGSEIGERREGKRRGGKGRRKEERRGCEGKKRGKYRKVRRCCHGGGAEKRASFLNVQHFKLHFSE